MEQSANFPLDIHGKRIDFNVITTKHIATKDLKKEPELFHTKWFDYRRKHPLQATMLFAKIFSEEGNRLYKPHILPIRKKEEAEEEKERKAKEEAEREAREALGFEIKKSEPTKKVRKHKNEEIFWAVRWKNFFEQDGRTYTSLWRARQKVDEMGIPYDFYIKEAMNFLIVKRKRRYVPRPNHIATEPVTEHVQKCWEKHLETSLQMPDDDRYKNQFYASLPEQKEFHNWIIESLEGKPSVLAETELARLVYKNQFLPECKAIKAFGETVLEHGAKRNGFKKRDDGVRQANTSPIIFGCCGMWQCQKSGDCETCLSKKTCMEVTEKTKTKLMTEFKSHDPIAEALRKYEREKKREQRKKIKKIS